MNYDVFFHRLLDIVEQDIMPLTRRGVKMGAKIYGAAIARRDDAELVVASTNHEASSPLWHGEVYAIKEFYELQNHPRPADCFMLATHQPCCMCASAIALAGIPEVWYLFGYEEPGADQDVIDGRKMIREIFGAAEPNPDNSYYTMRPLSGLSIRLADPDRARERFESIRKRYAELQRLRQSGMARSGGRDGIGATNAPTYEGTL